MYKPKLFDAPEVSDAPRIIVNDGGLVTYDPYFIDAFAGDELLNELLRNVPWKQEHLRMYGREIPFPRLTAWYGDKDASYTYSGITNRPLSWTPQLLRVRARLKESLGVQFNSVLLNLYRTGRDSLSWHADDEPELGGQPIIASISLGSTRRFELKRRDTGEIKRVHLEHGSLLVMSGDTQQCWKHQVPKEGTVTTPRINLTFRVIDARRNEKRTLPSSRDARPRAPR